MEVQEPAPESRALGPYKLDLLLGKGGLGEVYKAFDERLGRWVALKRLRGGGGGRHRKSLRREARTLAQLGHPSIVQIFDIVEDAEADWIVMELVDGPTLAELGRDGPLDIGLAVDYARQVTLGLGAAHAQGIIHRDLKTENVMVLSPQHNDRGQDTADRSRLGRVMPGRVKVLDFGLARRFTAESTDRPTVESPAFSSVAEISQPGRVAGTPRAMSPEQAAGRTLDARSDLFSLGVLLYEILTTRSPFLAETASETLRRVITHVPPPVRQLQPEVSDTLSALIDRLLEKDPDHRPQHASRVEAELERIASGGERLASLKGLSQVETLEAEMVDGVPPADAVVTTLLLSDLVGSTRLVETLGDLEAAALFRRHDRLARDLLEEHSGREIDKTDGFLLLFDRPSSAVHYALNYHQALRELGLTARVGIHLGEVILYRNTPRDIERGAKPIEVEGLAKPTAARLMSLAVGGQTLLTRAAYEVARRSTPSRGDESGQGPAEAAWKGLHWRGHGNYRFAGIGEAIEVFEAGVPGEAPLLAPSDSEKVVRVDSEQARTGTTQHPLRSRPVSVRAWAPPEIPEHPYPILLPYTHPDFLAGREQEIARLRRLLELPLPILGLSAPSGTGKSSLLIGGLVPTLRSAAIPVALLRHPAEAGVASRLIGDLLEGVEALQEGDAAGFVERLCEVERLAGAPPVLVLDQFEDLLCDEARGGRAVVGPLMAASVSKRPGLSSPPCRWLIAYRQEYCGQLDRWLGDVLAEARAAGMPGLDALPHDLSQPERCHSMTLPPLAKPSPGAGEALAESTRVFLATIEKPLTPSETAPWAFPWCFPPGHAERLARAFAETRQARPDAPLVPELQVVLAHLLAQAGPDGQVTVPEDPLPLIDEALDDHLRRALESAFPEATAAGATRRSRALLALRELATGTGRRDVGLRSDELARAIGESGEAILQQLATPLTRLVVVRQAEDGPRWVLAHDRMAEAVEQLVDEEGRQGQLIIDSELLALRRFVTLRTALYRSQQIVASRAGRGEQESATRVPRRHFRRIDDHAAALLWDEARRGWFEACHQRRREDRRRLTGFGTLALLVLALIGWGAWAWANRLAQQRALREQVVEGKPDTAFLALDRLSTQPNADIVELLGLVRKRDVPMDVLEGLGGLDEVGHSAAVLRAVEMALPWIEEDPQNSVLLANMLWALDFTPSRDPDSTERALVLRDRVLAPLRQLRPPPLPPEPGDLEWITVPFGSFLMGLGPGEPGNDRERPQHEVSVSAFRLQRHEVTNGEYRRLVPDHPRTDGDDELPVASVNWYEAYTYAAWLGGRLPTEAEWEYAARAGCPYAYCDREGLETTVEAVAWTVRNSSDVSTWVLAPRPVMRLEANPWGFYDMLGNMAEWVADGYQDYPDSRQSDPWSPITPGRTGVLRGGMFFNPSDWSRVTHRSRAPLGFAHVFTGFRSVLPRAPDLQREERRDQRP